MLKYYADADKAFDCIYILVFENKYLHKVKDDLEIKRILRIETKDIIQYYGKDIKKFTNSFSVNVNHIVNTMREAQEKLIEVLFEFWVR